MALSLKEFVSERILEVPKNVQNDVKRILEKLNSMRKFSSGGEDRFVDIKNKGIKFEQFHIDELLKGHISLEVDGKGEAVPLYKIKNFEGTHITFEIKGSSSEVCQRTRKTILIVGRFNANNLYYYYLNDEHALEKFLSEENPSPHLSPNPDSNLRSISQAEAIVILDLQELYLFDIGRFGQNIVNQGGSQLPISKVIHVFDEKKLIEDDSRLKNIDRSVEPSRLEGREEDNRKGFLSGLVSRTTPFLSSFKRKNEKKPNLDRTRNPTKADSNVIDNVVGELISRIRSGNDEVMRAMEVDLEGKQAEVYNLVPNDEYLLYIVDKNKNLLCLGVSEKQINIRYYHNAENMSELPKKLDKNRIMIFGRETSGHFFSQIVNNQPNSQMVKNLTNITSNSKKLDFALARFDDDSFYLIIFENSRVYSRIHNIKKDDKSVISDQRLAHA